MADGSSDHFDAFEDLDLHQIEPPASGRKRKSATPTPSPRDLAAELAMSLPKERPALIRIAAQALAAYDAAVFRDDPRAAEEARTLYEATIFRYNNDTWFASYGSTDAAGYVIARETAAVPGSPMGWNQKGVIRVTAGGVVAALDCTGGFSLGGGWSWHVLELDKPFISETGYLSYPNGPIIWGATFREAAHLWLENLVADPRKMVRIPPSAFVRTRSLQFTFLNPPIAASTAPSGLVAFPF